MSWRVIGCAQVLTAVLNGLTALKLPGDEGTTAGLVAALFAGLAAWSLTAKENSQSTPERTLPNGP